MKKLSMILVLATILAGSACLAIQTMNIDEQKGALKTTNAQNQKLTDTTLQIEELGKRYKSNFKTCEPVHVLQSIDLFGLKFSFKFDINGWTDNKCVYEMSAKVDGLGKDINEVYNLNIADEEISKIEPKVTCKFSQEELDTLVDAISASIQRAGEVREMSDKAAAEAAKSNLSPEEQKAIGMLVGSGACTAPDMAEVMTKYSELAKPQK